MPFYASTPLLQKLKHCAVCSRLLLKATFLAYKQILICLEHFAKTEVI